MQQQQLTKCQLLCRLLKRMLIVFFFFIFGQFDFSAYIFQLVLLFKPKPQNEDRETIHVNNNLLSFKLLCFFFFFTYFVQHAWKTLPPSVKPEFAWFKYLIRFFFFNVMTEIMSCQHTGFYPAVSPTACQCVRRTAVSWPPRWQGALWSHPLSVSFFFSGGPPYTI